MAQVVLNPADAQGGTKSLTIMQVVAGGGYASLNTGAIGAVLARYGASSASSSNTSEDIDTLRIKTRVANGYSLSGARFMLGGKEHVIKANGTVHIDLNPSTGAGTIVGSVSFESGVIELTAWSGGASPAITAWRAVAAAPLNGSDTPYNTYTVTFRIATAPVKPESVSIIGEMLDGTVINVAADEDGIINATRVKGVVNYTTGVVQLVFVSSTPTFSGQTQIDISALGVPGVSNVYVDRVQQESLRYNAVAYSYLPLDPALLGIDPVRLPADGRVPIFRPGGFVVVGHKAVTTPEAVADDDEIDCERTRLSRVRVVGNDGVTINTGYSADLESGVVTFTDVTGYSQPVRVEHYIEDMGQIRDAQIDGTITMLRPLTHVFPVGSYISSAFVAGDQRARTSLVFDQATWSPQTFLDVLSGDAALGTYNTLDHPVTVTNAGAVTERWALRFTTTTAFQIIGEHLGVIGIGSINEVCAPINTQTGEPYFTIAEEGWGTGWAIGNILRVNTIGAQVPVWVARTIKQGTESGEDYSFELLVRGDVDNPL